METPNKSFLLLAVFPLAYFLPVARRSSRETRDVARFFV